jgi:serine protease Do
MRLRHLTFIFALIVSLPALAQELPRAGFADLVEKLSPAVVNVSTTQKVKSGGVQMFGNLPNTPEMEPFRDFFERFGQMQGQPQEREVTSLGSGFIIDATGFIITNNHVIDDAEEITVTLPNNDKYKAKIIGRDKKVDLALLKIEAKKPLPFVPLGDSDAMRVGDWVIAIGNPYGLGGTVTQGIISARQRSINAGPFDDFLQTDAPINRGNSGGPLFNTSGEVIGINTAIFSPSGGGGSVGIGFAIPTSLAKGVIAQLKEFGRTHRGWLGVKIQEVSDEMADSVGLDKAKGALILETDPNGPAAKAGLKPGDVVTNFAGHDITEMRFLPRIVADTKIGSNVDITYFRKGKSITGKIKVGELEEKEDGAAVTSKGDKEDGVTTPGASKFLGMQMTPLTKELRAELRLPDSINGMVVLGVENDSPALKRGLKRGDVITEANGEAALSTTALKNAFAAAKKGGHKFVMVQVIRAGSAAFVTLPVE